MARSIFLTLIIAVLFSNLAFAIPWDLPDLELSTATMNHVGYDGAVLFVLPDGTGHSFADAQNPNDGTQVDATITLLLLNPVGDLIAGFPSEDLWLESTDGGLSLCIGGTTADHFTDATGETSWSNPLKAGGSSSGNTQVMISEMPLLAPPLALKFNSPDIDGNGYVNLLDVTLFTEAYFGPYDFSIDFYADGVLNLLDVSLMAYGLGSECN